MRVPLILVALTGVATADSYSFVGPDHNEWHDAHTEVSGGIAQVDGQIAGAGVHGRQFEVSVARRGKRLATELVYDAALVDGGAVHAGWLRQRAGLAVVGGYANSLRRWEAWIEVGAGVQRFDVGLGRHVRPALSFGLGADVNSGNDVSLGDALHWLGARVSVRIQAAPAPEAFVAQARERSSSALRDIDLAIVFGLSVLIGR